ncbi:hypothetical protein [Gordonia sp. (in: high G+C Gram-positive bacteria)]|uniref:hypothetical protein n=1 Tax=Gordonia sp. (in: high G+C Gram-positive bacteria) TaxID=84139 RepID=UPI003C7835C8
MGYRETLSQLAFESERAILATYRSFLEGLLDREETVRMIAHLIAEANGRARSLADMAMAAQMMVELQEPLPVTGVAYPDDVPRLRKAADTVLTVAEASEVPEAIVARLARSEPLEAAAEAAQDAMVRSGLTKGWIRQKSPNACQLCTWWWREGRVWPAEHPFQHHKGCTCSPKPVLREGIRETWKTARAKGIR